MNFPTVVLSGTATAPVVVFVSVTTRPATFPFVQPSRTIPTNTGTCTGPGLIAWAGTAAPTNNPTTATVTNMLRRTITHPNPDKEPGPEQVQPPSANNVKTRPECPE